MHKRSWQCCHPVLHLISLFMLRWPRSSNHRIRNNLSYLSINSNANRHNICTHYHYYCSNCRWKCQNNNYYRDTSRRPTTTKSDYYHNHAIYNAFRSLRILYHYEKCHNYNPSYSHLRLFHLYNHHHLSSRSLSM